MTKDDLIKLVALDAKINQKTAADAVTAVMTNIRTILFDGGKVELKGFGSFRTKIRASREFKSGLATTSDEPILIPEKRIVCFKPSKSLLG